MLYVWLSSAVTYLVPAKFALMPS